MSQRSGQIPPCKHSQRNPISGQSHREEQPRCAPVIVHEIIEWYDAPESEPEAHGEERTPYWAVLVGVAFLSILGGLLFVILRRR